MLNCFIYNVKFSQHYLSPKKKRNKDPVEIIPSASPIPAPLAKQKEEVNKVLITKSVFSPFNLAPKIEVYYKQTGRKDTNLFSVSISLPEKLSNYNTKKNFKLYHGYTRVDQMGRSKLISTAELKKAMRLLRAHMFPVACKLSFKPALVKHESIYLAIRHAMIKLEFFPIRIFICPSVWYGVVELIAEFEALHPRTRLSTWQKVSIFGSIFDLRTLFLACWYRKRKKNVPSDS